MSKPGRKPLADPRIPWRVYIRSKLAAEVELLLLDPMRQKVKYGSRGELIESLLEDWVDAQRKSAQNSPLDNLNAMPDNVGSR